VRLDGARRERGRIDRRGPFSMRRNFLATAIRHRLGFRELARHRRPLMRCVILSALVASLVPGVYQPVQGGLLELAAVLGAVPLPAVVRPADVEPLAASAAVQRKDNDVVHPTRMNENWTPTSATVTVRMYWLSIRRLYTRVQAPTWALIRFSALGTYRNASTSATSCSSSPRLAG